MLRNYYVAGEINRMSHHRSLNFFEIRFYDSYEPFRLKRNRFQLHNMNIMWKKTFNPGETCKNYE